MNAAQKFWDKQAERFDKSDTNFESANNELISRTREYLNPEDNVLDFGCATGRKTLKLAEGIKHVHGLDFSAEMIKEAIKNKISAAADNVSFNQGTIYGENLKKSSFDKIIAYSVIHLLEDSDNAIQRIYELLKPGGLFISETACFKDNMNLKTRMEVTIFFLLKRLGVFPLHLNKFNTNDLEQLIRKNNFNIIKSDNLFYNGMTLSFIVAEKI
jgi:ubiquinone/menaquinone biosynthesis C-methylase UbiE